MTASKGKDPDSLPEEDPVVEKLIPDPAEPPKLKVLVGLLGRSAREGYWRLYVTAHLDEYFEFHGNEVCHHQRLESHQAPFGGTVVWLRATAEIIQARSTPAATTQEFLQGEIARALSLVVAPGLIGLRPWLGAVNTWNCPHQTAGTCTLVACTRVEECKISREANPCA
jgi:hypothetical protein